MLLRPIEDRLDEHEWLLSVHNDPEVLKFLTHPHSVSLTEHMEWFKHISRHENSEAFIAENDGVRFGITKFYQLDHDNGSCGLGANIHKDHRGKGYAKPMWSLMLDRCFNFYKFHRVWLTTAEYNIVGHKIYSSLGFIEEGRQIQSLNRNGRYYDQICMYMLRKMWNKE
jgi:RimJ/RimL family protein N-acetyltransferase